MNIKSILQDHGFGGNGKRPLATIPQEQILATGKATGTSSSTYSFVMAIDPVNQRIFVTNQGSASPWYITVFDYGLNIITSLNWNSISGSANAPTSITPVSSTQSIIVGASDKICSIKWSTGAKNWVISAGGYKQAYIAKNDTWYFTGLTKYNATTGAQIATYSSSYGIPSCVAVDPTNTYVFGMTGYTSSGTYIIKAPATSTTTGVAISKTATYGDTNGTVNESLFFLNGFLVALWMDNFSGGPKNGYHVFDTNLNLKSSGFMDVPMNSGMQSLGFSPDKTMAFGSCYTGAYNTNPAVCAISVDDNGILYSSSVSGYQGGTFVSSDGAGNFFRALGNGTGIIQKLIYK